MFVYMYVCIIVIVSIIIIIIIIIHQVTHVLSSHDMTWRHITSHPIPSHHITSFIVRDHTGYPHPHLQTCTEIKVSEDTVYYHMLKYIWLSCGKAELWLFVGFLLFNTLLQDFARISPELHQKFTRNSPEFHRSSPEDRVGAP